MKDLLTLDLSFLKVKEECSIQMRIFMMENGRTGSFTEKENFLGKMDLTMKANIVMEQSMVKANLFILQASTTKEIGNRVDNMDREKCIMNLTL